MKSQLQAEISRDFQIKKFCAYGFLKNLKFFEPYLLIFLLGKGLDLFEIGILIAIREVVINLFEIPSGLIADFLGRKKELYACFSFYILSFLCFFCTHSFWMAAAAMALFGLGEAFRSGTHKAMIYTYLDHRGWQKEKTFVYGRTRSFSLIGSAVSALIGILLILWTSSVNQIFLFSILPYVLDFLLILSYPRFLDAADQGSTRKLPELLGQFAAGFRRNGPLRRLLWEEGMFEAAISFIKDLIQPMLEASILGSGLVLLSRLTPEDNLHVILGLVYVVLNLFGSFTSRKAYVLRSRRSSCSCLFLLHLLLALSMGALALVFRHPLPVFAVYLGIYALFNIRKPIFVDEIDEHIDKSERATVLSLSSQLKSLFLMVFAPVLGYLADRFGMGLIMGLLCLLFLLTLPLLPSKA